DLHETHPARDALEEPDVRDRRGQLDVAHPFAAHFRPRHFHPAAVADDALVPDALVFAAMALPVLRGTEDFFAKEAFLLRFQRAVVDRLRLFHFAAGPGADFFRGRETDLHELEIVDVHQGTTLLPV